MTQNSEVDMGSACEQFEHEMQIFRGEVETCIQLLYAHLTVHNTAARKPRLWTILNHHRIFWKTTLYAYQCAGFIALGRIFDQSSPHNVDRLLASAQRYPHIFSKDALADRKKRSSANWSSFLTRFLSTAHIVVPDDFRRLRKQVAVHRRIYKAACDDIRDKVFAHNEITGERDIAAMFRQIKVGQFQKLVVFLNRLHEALWQLYYNGRKPVLPRMPHSALNIARTTTKPWQHQTVQQLIVEDTRGFLESMIPDYTRAEQRKSRRVRALTR